MADSLTAVKTTVAQGKDKNAQELTVLASRPTKKDAEPQYDQPIDVQLGQNTDSQEVESAASAVDPDRILRLLKGQPSIDVLQRTLEQIRSGAESSTSFNIDAVGLWQARIIKVLVDDTVPNFWSSMRKSDRILLLSCLKNVAGTGAMLAKIRRWADGVSTSKESAASFEGLKDLLAAFQQLLQAPNFLDEVWNGLCQCTPSDTNRSMTWKKFVNLVGSGKVISTVAYAEDALRSVLDTPTQGSWMSSASEYAKWLGMCIVRMVATDAALLTSGANAEAASQILVKAFSLGKSLSVVETILTYTVSTEPTSTDKSRDLRALVSRVPGFTKRQFLETTLQWLSQISASMAAPAVGDASDRGIVPGLAACINLVVGEDRTMLDNLQAFATDSTLTSIVTPAVRRAILVIVAQKAPEKLQNLLEKLLATFGDQLFVTHAPIVQQDSIAQVLLLTAGCLHRRQPMAVLMTARSSGHMSGTSNRLHSSNTRARWLGMIVATAISSLVDKADARMNFDTDDMRLPEAEWYKKLVLIDDWLGNIVDFRQLLLARSKRGVAPREARAETLPIIGGKQSFGPPRPPVQTEVIGEKVTEILDDDEDDDDELKPYAKPDSDPEDSDEDATLVNRDKARPPIYVRDLMRMLREDKKHDVFQLAIKHAAPLIRRKANFGREVKDHAEEIGLLLCDLQDPFDTEDFDELKLQALIAVLLSDVVKMAPWLSRHAFSGDYSLSQRCIMLSALGLGGRELAGLTESDRLNPALPDTSFPSKKLPARLDAMYNPTSTAVNRLDSASSSVENAIMKPLALSAADQITSHLNAVKIKKFSRRMDVERTKRKPAANQLAKVFATHFFAPMVTRYQQDIAAYGQRSVFVSAPVVLVTFIRTLALLLHASGPATMGLADVTASFWDLLLSLRVASINDISIMESVLFALLTILEVSCEWGDKTHLAQEQPKRLADTQSWVEIVFEKTGSGGLILEGESEESKVRMLAAGVLVKCRDIVEGYQKGLMGGVGT